MAVPEIRIDVARERRRAELLKRSEAGTEQLKKAEAGFGALAGSPLAPLEADAFHSPGQPVQRSRRVSLEGTTSLVPGGRSIDLGNVARRGPTEVAARINGRMAEKYPPLAFMLKDPDAFVDAMQVRFQEQKRLTPGRPYQFDYSELGMPVVEDIDKNLRDEIALLTQRRIAAPAGEEARELDVALKYLSDLKQESARYVARGAVRYQDLVELSYFYTRAIGHFDTRQYGLRDTALLKIFDRKINGYKEMSIDQEYEAFLHRDFKVFQMESAARGFKDAHEPFARAFSNSDWIEDLWVPTTAALGADVLMRLMNKNIELVGVAYKPFFSDGFLRTAGDFWVHDLRHSSDKFLRRAQYLERYQLTPDQVERLDAKSDQWGEELELAKSRVADPGLREAIELMSFNFHHDRGFPLLPSAYLDPKASPVGIAALLYLQLRIGGDGAHSELTRPVRNFTRANAWLKAFWQARLHGEREINPRL